MKKNLTYLLAHVLTFIFGFIVTLILPKYLDVSSYAKLSIEIAFFNILIPISAFGLIPYIIRNYKKYERGEFDLRKNIIFLYLIGNLASIIALLFIMYFDIIEISNEKFLIITFALSAVSLTTIASGYYRAAKKSIKYFTVVGCSKSLLLLIIVIFLIYIDNWTNNYYFVALFFSSVIAIIICKGEILPPKVMEKPINKKSYSDAIKYCLPIAVSNVFVMLVPLVERNVINTLLSSETLAQYVFNFEVAAKISAVFLLSLKVIIWPNIVGKSGREESLKYKKYGLALIPLLSLTVVIVIAFGKPVYEFLVANYLNQTYNNFTVFSYSVAYSALIILLYYVNLSVLLTGKTYLMTAGCVVISLFHYYGMIYLIPNYGVDGACISLLVSTTLGILFTIIFNFKSYIKLSLEDK